ncbi:MAG: ATP-binding protein [Steroidobacteraceae bacterium]
MRIGRIVTVSAIVSSLGAVLLCGWLAVNFTRLESKRDQLGSDALVLGDSRRLEDTLRQWTLLSDLVFGSNETYLQLGAVEQGRLALELIAQLERSPLTADAAPGLAVLRDLIARNAEALDQAAVLTPAEHDALNALMAEWDSRAPRAIEALGLVQQQLQIAVDRNRLAYERARDRLRGWAVALLALFSLAVFAMWLWVRRVLVQPIERLTDAVDEALRIDRPVSLEPGGPAEVRRLFASAATFAATLETRISERTRELQHEVGERREAQRLAEQASRAKDQFLANMSHEIRTPLNGILGHVELLMLPGVADAHHKELAAIQRSGEQLLKVVNEVLDFAKLQDGADEVRDETCFRLRELVTDLTTLYAPRCAKAGVALQAHVDDSLPDRLVGDAYRLHQVLANLLSNAVKFTEQGAITLHVRRVRGDGPSVTAQFEVSDTGIGIDDADIAKVFEPFTQVDEGMNRRHGGTGLGLAICQRVVALLGGELRAESRRGEGSRFFFDLTLEVAAADSVDDSPGAPPGATRLPRGLRVLLVEDNEINRVVAGEMLRRQGCEVAIVGDGESAISARFEGEFDLVLMDVQMPGCDGLEATRRIRERERREHRPELPVYALTANVLAADIRACTDAGMNGHLGKPLRMNELATLLQWLQAA